MPGPLIDHIGVLVENLEEAIERWSRILDYTFEPITRYRTDRWVDLDGPEPHRSDVRLSFSYQGPPHIELMEFTGTGTHSPAEGPGFHHFGFSNIPDLEGRITALTEAGVRNDGRAIGEDGSTILWFGEKRDFDGVRLEFVGVAQQPIVTDSGEQLTYDENGVLTMPDGTKLFT
jgi:catechol 2,3-dioxygenase-like lactoylglutathione lyase family enzyme